MEIERKFLIKNLPESPESFDSFKLEQAYISRKPVIRVRRVEKIAGTCSVDTEDTGDITYILTVKGKGTLAREELNLGISAESFNALAAKAEGPIIRKQRYLIPYGELTIELDHFFSPNEGLWLAEVEFKTVEQANAFAPPDWFGEDVTANPAYHNSNMK